MTGEAAPKAAAECRWRIEEFAVSTVVSPTMIEPATPRAARVGLVHFALAVGGFAIGTTEFATMSLLPYFARDLRIDEPTAGHVISAYALGVVVGAPLIAVLSAKVARRTILVA